VRYDVRFAPCAAKELAKLPRNVQLRLAPKIDALAANPRPPGAEKLAGADAWRIRVGDDRLVYEVHDRVVVVLVLHIGNRREICRRVRR
jgi:mRNA interferase RelE/StbE